MFLEINFINIMSIDYAPFKGGHSKKKIIMNSKKLLL